MYCKDVNWEAFDDDDNEMIELGMSLLEEYLTDKPNRPNPDFMRAMFLDEFDGFEDVEGDVKNAIVVKAMNRWEELHPDKARCESPAKAAITSKASSVSTPASNMKDNDSEEQSGSESAKAEENNISSEEMDSIYQKHASNTNDTIREKISAALAAFAELSANRNDIDVFWDEGQDNQVERLYKELDRVFADFNIAPDAVRRDCRVVYCDDDSKVFIEAAVSWMDDDGLHQEKSPVPPT